MVPEPAASDEEPFAFLACRVTFGRNSLTKEETHPLMRMGL
jgi:hypothetical protein